MFLLILTLLFALLIAIFAVQNAAPVAINLFWITTQAPLVLIILGSVLAGALIVFLIALWRQIRPQKKDKVTPMNKGTTTILDEEKKMDSKENNFSE